MCYVEPDYSAKVETVVHTGSDPYYGHEHSAHLCAHFIMHLFACDEYYTTLCGSGSRLTYFIANTLYQTKLHSSVTFTALLLLQHLKIHFPTTHGSSCQCLFIAAFMIASKVMSDDKYSNKSWSIVGQGIDEPPHQICSYTLLFSLFHYFLCIINPPLHTLALM